MARVSIYVPDDLKARMDEAKDAVNWSEVARPAFEHALATYHHRKENTVQTAIERLKASKAKHQVSEEEVGKIAGRKWAADKADYSDLVALSKAPVLFSPDEPSEVLCKTLNNGGELGGEDIAIWCFGDVDWPSEEYVAGFIEGAQEFYDEVKDQL